MDTEERIYEMERHLGEVADKRTFFIRYNNSESNMGVHKAFIDFCWRETDGNYLQGIKKLLENYAEDFRYNLLCNKIEDVAGSVIELATKEKEDNCDERDYEKVF